MKYNILKFIHILLAVAISCFCVSAVGDDAEGFHESTYYISGTATKGLSVNSTDADLIEAIWRAFETRLVKRKDGKTLHYYLSHETQNVFVAQLLKYGDGQCGAWTRFFLDCLRVQGINTTGTYVTIGWWKDEDSKKGILVKDWIFIGNGTSGDTEYPYINIFDANGNLLYAEVRPLNSLPGQNNPNTPLLFNNHQFAYIGEKYRDPSYGLSSPDDRDFGLSGYWKIEEDYDVSKSKYSLNIGNNSGDDIVPMTVMLFKKKIKNWAPYEFSDN